MLLIYYPIQRYKINSVLGNKRVTKITQKRESNKNKEKIPKNRQIKKPLTFNGFPFFSFPFFKTRK